MNILGRVFVVVLVGTIALVSGCYNPTVNSKIPTSNPSITISVHDVLRLSAYLDLTFSIPFKGSGFDTNQIYEPERIKGCGFEFKDGLRTTLLPASSSSPVTGLAFAEKEVDSLRDSALYIARAFVKIDDTTFYSRQDSFIAIR